MINFDYNEAKHNLHIIQWKQITMDITSNE